VVAKEVAAVEAAANCAFRAVEEWLSVAGLELASHKTEAVLISSRKAVESAHIQVGGTSIVSQSAIRYLGVMLDTHLSYREHQEYVNKKANKTTGSLFRILLNTRGPKQDRRKLPATVVRSQLLYAAPVWAESTAVSSYMRGVNATYRLCAVLWNTMYDGVLKLPLPSSTNIVSFADDVALVVVAKEVAAVEAAANCAFRAVEEWLSVAGLELASHKTEAVLISSRKAVESAHIQVGGTSIVSQSAIRYLGVMLDTRLSYREHQEYVNKKANKTTGSLFRILLNTRGPKQDRRKLPATVVRSQLLYAAPVWSFFFYFSSFGQLNTQKGFLYADDFDQGRKTHSSLI